MLPHSTQTNISRIWNFMQLHLFTNDTTIDNISLDQFFYQSFKEDIHSWLMIASRKTMVECIDAFIFHQLSSILAINWNGKEKRSKFRLLYQVCRFIYFVVVSENVTHSRGNGINITSYAICNLRIILCIARTFKGQNSPHLILSKTASW